ncbi:MAG: Ubiquinone/menaquinone biosynthesis C-methyltransferase UbiE [Candidatus Methanogaster sp.]|nr:MAG: Ubiquinone/menaquinone biosynthesis C-methyltransferase UbiE [ANME-2 cluster archaeon]
MHKSDEEYRVGQKSRQKDFYDERFSDIKRGLMKLREPTLLYDLNLAKKILAEAHISKNSIVLEVCAGQSTDAILISDYAGVVISTDISFQALQTAQELAQLRNKDNISFVVCDAEHLPFHDDIFDFAFCKDALHHVLNPTKVLSEMKGCSKNLKRVTVIEANAYNPQMILIGLLYYSIDKGVFRNTKKNLTQMFQDSSLSDIKVEYSEFLPRHILFYVRSPLLKVIFKYPYLMNVIKFINKIEKRVELLCCINKFTNFIIISGVKSKHESDMVEVIESRCELGGVSK